MKYADIEYLNVEPNDMYSNLTEKVINKCFETEHLLNKNINISIIYTTPIDIQEYNKEYRNIDRATDVLSFPMFEKDEVEKFKKEKSVVPEVLGDIIINLSQVKMQADEYGHSFERELAYMLVHGFYHLMGYDHMEEEEKRIMRLKEEKVLEDLKINRE
ncbi:MAG TPA: rRNA maturation RNase YbeY [Clostridiaceae bacterium]|jgi:probable rRNA maturation factor|nr:rRNA maturation RNase YbeY [Clostridium sp.]MEE0128052.1 rRNA maturation RNase YbeY [Clostridia bacterium]HJJ12292.1 rRNA maturation RNase YbeY [Clostridiaceae bacterium]